MHRAVVVVSVIALALVFACAAAAKFANPAAAELGASDLGVPSRWAPAVARVLPLLEGTTAGLLLLGLVLRPIAVVGSALALALLIAFTAVILRSLRAGRRPVCQCFGSFGSRPIGTDTVIRNGALLLLALVAIAG